MSGYFGRIRDGEASVLWGTSRPVPRTDPLFPRSAVLPQQEEPFLLGPVPSHGRGERDHGATILQRRRARGCVSHQYQAARGSAVAAVIRFLAALHAAVRTSKLSIRLCIEVTSVCVCLPLQSPPVGRPLFVSLSEFLVLLILFIL